MLSSGSVAARQNDDDGAYESEEFGYTVEWTDEFTFGTPEADDGRDFIRLFTLQPPDLSLEIEGLATDDTPEERLADAIAAIEDEADETEVLVEETSDERATAVLLTTSDGPFDLYRIDVTALQGSDGLLTVSLRHFNESDPRELDESIRRTNDAVRINDNPPFDPEAGQVDLDERNQEEQANAEVAGEYESEMFGFTVEWMDTFIPQGFDEFAERETLKFGAATPPDVAVTIESFATDLSPEEQLAEAIAGREDNVDEVEVLSEEETDGRATAILTETTNGRTNIIRWDAWLLDDNAGVITARVSAMGTDDEADLEDAVERANAGISIDGQPLLGDGAGSQDDGGDSSNGDGTDENLATFESDLFGFTVEWIYPYQSSGPEATDEREELQFWSQEDQDVLLQIDARVTDDTPEDVLDNSRSILEESDPPGEILVDDEVDDHLVLVALREDDGTPFLVYYEAWAVEGADNDGVLTAQLVLSGSDDLADLASAVDAVNAGITIDGEPLFGGAEVISDDPQIEEGDDPSAGGDLETYESPSHGYTLEYDGDAWQEMGEDPDPDDTYDIVTFQHELGILRLIGTSDFSETQLDDCVEGAAASLEQSAGISDIEEVEGETGEDDGRAYAAYSFTYDGADDETIQYIECRSVGSITVVILQESLADDYEDFSEAREELLERLEA